MYACSIYTWNQQDQDGIEEARGESCHRVDWFFGWAHRFPIVFVFLFLIFLFVFSFYREASPVCYLYSPSSISCLVVHRGASM